MLPRGLSPGGCRGWVCRSERQASPVASGLCRALPASLRPPCLLQPSPGEQSGAGGPMALEEGALTFLLQNVLSGLDECQDVRIRLAVSGEGDGRSPRLRDAGDNHMSRFTAPYVWTQRLPFPSAFPFSMTPCHPGGHEDQWPPPSCLPLICAAATANLCLQMCHVLTTFSTLRHTPSSLVPQLTQTKPI